MKFPNISKMYDEQDTRIKVLSDRPWFKSVGDYFQKIIIISVEDQQFFAIRAFARLENGEFIPQKGLTLCCEL